MASAPSIIDVVLRRSFDAAAINRICNHPAVQDGLSLGQGEIDVTALISDEKNIAFLGEYGGAMFHWSAPGIYDAHDFFLPEGRGKWATEASLSMLGMMFGAFGARMIWAATPVENKACRFFNRRLGFKSEGIGKHKLVPGLDPILCEIFVMERT